MVRHEGETGDPGGASGPPGSPRVWVLPLPFRTPPLTYNQMMGKHWSAVHGLRRTLLEAGFYLSRARQASCPRHEFAGPVDIPDVLVRPGRMLPRPFLIPVTVELIYWPGNNTVHDSDNMAPTLKYLVDGLRKSGVLSDDRGKYVRSAICTVIERADDPEDRADARMVLVVREL